MIWLIVLCGLVAEPQLIPLKEVWADAMPQTQDVYKLGPIETIRQIRKVLAARQPAGTPAGTAFIVVGKGREALEQARDVLTKQKAAPATVQSTDELTLVFYSRSCGRYVRVNAILTYPHEIVVKYQFVSHFTLEVTTHFALIPLGKLPPGKTKVTMQLVGSTAQADVHSKPIPEPLRYVSGPFSFEVK